MRAQYERLNPVVPSPQGYGWNNEDGQLVLVKCQISYAPEFLLGFVKGSSFKSRCQLPCLSNITSHTDVCVQKWGKYLWQCIFKFWKLVILTAVTTNSSLIKFTVYIRYKQRRSEGFWRPERRLPFGAPQKIFFCNSQKFANRLNYSQNLAI